MVQPADRAALSPLHHPRFPVDRDRRATGQRRRLGPVAQLHRHDLAARLAGHLRGRRERLHGGRSARPEPPLRRHGEPVQPGPQRTGNTLAAAAGPGAGPRQLDAAARVLAGRPSRAVLREPVSLQDERRRDVDAHLGRSHPPRARRARDARSDDRRDDRSQRAPRRHLHHRAVSRAQAAALDRHRRRADSAHDG